MVARPVDTVLTLLSRDLSELIDAVERWDGAPRVPEAMERPVRRRVRLVTGC